MRRASLLLMTIAALAAFAATAADTTQVHPAITAAVESKDRPEADRQRDARRKPALVLEFFGVRPGMTMLDGELDALRNPANDSQKLFFAPE